MAYAGVGFGRNGIPQKGMLCVCVCVQVMAWSSKVWRSIYSAKGLGHIAHNDRWHVYTEASSKTLRLRVPSLWVSRVRMGRPKEWPLSKGGPKGGR